MNEIIMQYVRDYGTKALMSLLATFGGCFAGGCATQITGIGQVSEKPVFTFDGFGLKLAVHSVEMTFKHEVDETP